MLVVKVDPLEGVYPIDIELNWENYRKQLGVSTLYPVYTTIGGMKYEIIVDDNGLLKENYPSAISKTGRPVLVGPLLILHYDLENDKEYGLTLEDLEVIYNHLFKLIPAKGVVPFLHTVQIDAETA